MKEEIRHLWHHNAAYMNLNSSRRWWGRGRLAHSIHGAAKSDWASELNLQAHPCQEYSLTAAQLRVPPSLILKSSCFSFPTGNLHCWITCDWWVTYLLQASNSRETHLSSDMSTSRVTSWFPNFIVRDKWFKPKQRKVHHLPELH